MVLNYLFTGLIAALLSVPGTGQKEVATVGEEPVVKKEVKTLAPATFYHKGSGIYERNPGLGTACQPDLVYPCTITYDDETEVENLDGFEYDERPLFDRTESDEGVWM